MTFSLRAAPFSRSTLRVMDGCHGATAGPTTTLVCAIEEHPAILGKFSGAITGYSHLQQPSLPVSQPLPSFHTSQQKPSVNVSTKNRIAACHLMSRDLQAFGGDPAE